MAELFDPYHRWLGIPPEHQPPNHYRLLGIGLFEDQPDVIEYAADRQMAHLRTFQVGPHAAVSQRLLNEVATAKLCLLRAEKKAAYDEFLRGRLGNSKRAGASADKSRQPPPFPVAPPEQELPIVELGEIDGQLVGAPAAPRASDPLRRRRRAAITAIGLAVGLLLAIVVLATRLTSAPSPRAPDGTVALSPVPPAVDAQPTVEAQPSAGSAAEPTTPSVPSSLPANDATAGDEELAFWEWLMEGDEPGPGAVAAASAKPQESAPAAEGPPKAGAGKSDAMANPPAKGETVTVVTPKPADVLPQATPESPRPPTKKPELKPEPFKTAAQLDPLVAEAWNLIRRGEYVKGRDRLVQASKLNREDLRVPFSLGLVDAVVNHEWTAAEKEFQQCVQEHPKHVASLNNLALVRLRLNRETQSVRHWQTALGEGPPPDEIVQNLGRVRFLLQKGRLSLKPVTQKAFNNLFVDSQLAGSGRFDDGVGYRYMGLYGGGNPDFGWREAHDYEDRWCPVCNATGKMKCPERDCKNGSRARMQSKFVGLNPINKTPMYSTSVANVPCTTCNGTGWYPCSFCRDGKDRQLK